MHGVSEVIAIILILMITIAIAGLAYTFMSSTMASTTSAASSAVTTTTSSMLTSFTIESMDVAKVYIRNTGQNALSSISVYVNDEPAIFNITPATITTGQVGTITIYSFIPDGATVKITSPSGFSASKVANPCSKAVGCWKFDESSGTIAYDSSPYSNNGNLINGPVWTSGIYGNAVKFDGINDYFEAPSTGYSLESAMTIQAWVNLGQYPDAASPGIGQRGYNKCLSIGMTGYVGFGVRAFSTPYFEFWDSTTKLRNQTWHFIVGTFLQEGPNMNGKIYIDGRHVASNSVVNTPYNTVNNPIRMATQIHDFGDYLNGTIDEVRIYNRAIY